MIELRHDMNARFTSLTEKLTGPEEKILVSDETVYIEVPEEIAERFEKSLDGYRESAEEPFPLQKGMDAFAQNFEEVSIFW